MLVKQVRAVLQEQEHDDHRQHVQEGQDGQSALATGKVKQLEGCGVASRISCFAEPIGRPAPESFMKSTQYELLEIVGLLHAGK